MNSTPTPIAVEPDNAPIARADEQLAQAHEQITLANQELTLLSEQLAKMERDAERPPSSGPGPQSPPRRPALRVISAFEKLQREFEREIGKSTLAETLRTIRRMEELFPG